MLTSGITLAAGVTWVGWHIERRGSVLRVDLDGAPISEMTEKEMVSDITAELEREDGVATIHLDGPGVRRPTEGVVRLIRAAGQLARERNLRYKVTRM
jgi:hypothetical protein